MKKVTIACADCGKPRKVLPWHYKKVKRCIVHQYMRDAKLKSLRANKKV